MGLLGARRVSLGTPSLVWRYVPGPACQRPARTSVAAGCGQGTLPVEGSEKCWTPWCHCLASFDHVHRSIFRTFDPWKLNRRPFLHFSCEVPEWRTGGGSEWQQRKSDDCHSRLTCPKPFLWRTISPALAGALSIDLQAGPNRPLSRLQGRRRWVSCWPSPSCQWRWEVGPLGRSKTVPLGVNGQHKCPH